MRTGRLIRKFAVILTLLVGVLSSSAQTTGSVQVVMTGGGLFTLVANPLNVTTNTFANLFSQVPLGTSFQRWNTSIQDFIILRKYGFPGPWDTATLNPGEAVFVNITGSTITNTFSGAILQGNVTNHVDVGFNMIGNMLPDSGTPPQLNLNPPIGTIIQKWNVTIQDFEVYRRVPFGGGWSPTAPTINAGEGFFIYATQPFDWVRNFTAP